MKTTYLSFGIIFISLAGCSQNGGSGNPRIAQRQAMQNLPAIGTTVLIKAMDNSATANSVPSSVQNVMLMVLADAAPLSYGAHGKLLMFAKHEDAEPVYSFTPQELKDMATTTHCSAELIAMMTTATGGEAMFCGGSLDLTKVHYFVFKEDDGGKDAATSFVVDFTKPDRNLVGITINLD